MAYKPTYDAMGGRVAALEKELKHTQKRLALFQEDETLYRLVVDNARDAIFLMDTDSERLIHANKTAQEMVGRSIESFAQPA